MTESFNVISTLRYDPALPGMAEGARNNYPDSQCTPYYLLPYHQDRLLSAARCFNWPDAVKFLEQDRKHFLDFLDSFIPDPTKPWRLRILIDKDGTGRVEASMSSPGPVNLLTPFDMSTSSIIWRVHVDSQWTTPSAFTTHKTTQRDNYTEVRLRAGIKSPKDQVEVLMVNQQGEVMEGSITTVYFRRPSPSAPHGEGKASDAMQQWITPPLASGGNAGTTRRFALASRLCSEEVINAADLRDGDACWISNGVRGFIRGEIVR
ncbi:uncharacterized protein N7446_013102 [Penicillium canescens]|uniref:Aminodeoxychorismate lyase n=1 Tax=Penicillium canescens TaxID=5083 RepID=A0AAD6N1W5_PENCN|nr:uncharacterized protein N7446_013102 [Penicillium canescens]KAJ6022750.1 hypothetical protein N7460_013145 [Penicillium canescens]KAJ6025986.1 hypothetical protein N7444_013665 [Penicillium canescens]KAJ6042036.1 hypothetical protein N7446_013102 [Penicillium canescens]